MLSRILSLAELRSCLSAGAFPAPQGFIRMRNDPSPPLAVSPGEAARLLGLGRTKLYAALTSGELASYKIGARRLIRFADLEDWLGRHAVEPSDATRAHSSAKRPPA